MGKNENIITAARELFIQYSFDKVSMDEIAKKAGVTKKTIYYYFRDKQELFQYFISEELEKMHKKFEATEKKKETFLEKVSENLNHVLSVSKDNQLLIHLIKEKESKSFHHQDFFQVYETRIISYLEKKIKEEISKGNIKECDAHLTAFIIYKTIYSLTFEYDEKFDRKRVCKEVTNILTNGLLIKGGDKNEK